MGVGTALAWSSPGLEKLSDPQGFLYIDKEKGKFVSSLITIGAMIGACPAGSLANAVGRKWSLLIISLPFILSWLIIMFARNVEMLYCARIISGIAVGASCVLVPTYVSEISEQSVKGTMGALFQLLLTVGIVMAYATGAVTNYSAFSAICAFVEVVFLLSFPWMPESPVWLIVSIITVKK